MPSISNASLDRLKKKQAFVMDDLCNIYHITLVSGTYGNSQEVRTASHLNVSCGIEFTNGKIVQSGQVMFVDYDCILRVADDVTILENDEVDLIEKGMFAISGTFKPYSAPVVNSSVQHVQLKRTTP